nr:hypothetical protein [Tanacetum cinerariifolium]
SQNLKLQEKKEKAKVKVALLKAQPVYPSVTQLTELLVTSLKHELSDLLALYNFASFIPTELKELPSKITKLSGEVTTLKKHVQGIKIMLPEDLKNIPNKLKTFTSIVSILTSHVDELKTLQWEFPTEFHAVDKSVPSAGHAGASPTDGEKNTDQATKDADKANLKQQPTTTAPPNTLSFHSPFFTCSPRRTPQTEEEIIKKDKGIEAMSSKDAKEEDTKSDSENDHTNPTNSMVKSFKKTPTISPLEIVLALRSKVSLIPVTVRICYSVFTMETLVGFLVDQVKQQGVRQEKVLNCSLVIVFRWNRRVIIFGLPARLKLLIHGDLIMKRLSTPLKALRAINSVDCFRSCGGFVLLFEAGFKEAIKITHAANIAIASKHANGDVNVVSDKKFSDVKEIVNTAKVHEVTAVRVLSQVTTASCVV